jgi:hypothetical protein
MDGYLRILFAFAARREAVLLAGDEETDKWQQWYDGQL